MRARFGLAPRTKKLDGRVSRVIHSHMDADSWRKRGQTGCFEGSFSFAPGIDRYTTDDLERAGSAADYRRAILGRPTACA